MGMIIGKDITAKTFTVLYQCSCGMSGSIVFFPSEGKKACEACGQMYQLRVMIGKVPSSRRPTTSTMTTTNPEHAGEELC